MKSLRSGFTLLEIIVVLAIIAILSAILIRGYDEVRQNARDDVRVAHLDQIAVAARLHKNLRGTYVVPNTGWVNGSGDSTSSGHFSYSNTTNYPVSIHQGLVDARLMPDAPILDPLVPDHQSMAGRNGHYGYMYYTFDDGNHFCVYASLENPTPDEYATMQNPVMTTAVREYLNDITGESGDPSSGTPFNMNYAVCL